MFTRSTLAYLLLVALAATALPEPVWCCGAETDKQQPVKESEEQEEASGKSEIEDGDDLEAFVIVASGVGWRSRCWTLQNLDTCLSCRIFQHGLEHCRAPPALLL